MTGTPAPTTAPLLDRFVAALSHIVHEEHPEAMSRPITVAELYQDIAPYRRMRELAGIEMHADYEHALIQLLAGVGDHARIDPDTAAEDLLIEAESADPDLSIYRKYAACDVRLQLVPADEAPLPPARVPAPEAEPLFKPQVRGAVVEPEPHPEPHARGGREAQPPEKSQMRTAAVDREALHGRTSRGASERKSEVVRCSFCGQGLPPDRDVHFCPWCGGDLAARQCAACGESLEEGWRFCVACGTAADT